MKTLLVILLAATAVGGFAQPDTRFQEFQPARITQTVDPYFPDSLVATHRRGGEVILLVSLDEAGRPTDYLPVRSTDPLFAESAINAVKQWKFEPARVLRELDRIPVPLQAVSPRYPEELARLGAVGEITVDFYIDERGAVRMPYVSSHAQPLLARLAVDAVRQWKFEPPTRRGQPVLVHVRQLFRFTGKVAAKN
ncbi:MAG: energy transducer TonB [Verrucomicrobia bacterium]|nr:energy transducer TonB [Verrucomicrobiota bacterium]